MRRMRDSDWRTFRTALVLIGVAIGLVAMVHGVTRRWNPGWAPGGWSAVRGHTKSVLIVSSNQGKSGKSTGKAAIRQPKRGSAHPERSIASGSGGAISGFFSRVLGAVDRVKTKITGRAPARESYSAVQPGGASLPEKGGISVPKNVARIESPSVDVEELVAGSEQKFAENEFGTTGDGQYCTASEFRGPGIGEAGVTVDEWKKQMKEFHAAKKELLSWFARYSLMLPPKMVQAMETQVKDLRIQRPPTTENSDLGWRGIGVLMRDSEGQLILRLGGGFPTLTKRAPERARFELIRLLAQSWSPCELARLGDSSGLWKKTMACLGVEEAQACDEGSYSEAGWAVSSAIAAVVSPPPCTLPVFRSQKYRACLDGLKSDGASRAPASEGRVQ